MVFKCIILDLRKQNDYKGKNYKEKADYIGDYIYRLMSIFPNTEVIELKESQ